MNGDNIDSDELSSTYQYRTDWVTRSAGETTCNLNKCEKIESVASYIKLVKG